MSTIAYTSGSKTTPGLFVGASFDSYVAKQLTIRKKIIGKESERSNEQIVYLNAKNSWVRLSSSVDVDNSIEVAKNNVLQGGTISVDSNTTTNKIGIKGGIGKGSKFAYNLTDELGYRPMAGITSVDIISKSRFGTLRDANVSFNCWTLEQLQIMEQLYMRPGYSVLLEWGHTIYYDNTEKYQTQFTPINFFDTSLTKEKIYSLIKTNKERSGCNYDAVFGFVKNFNWSIRDDGGYDCTVNIVAIGDVIDSLKINTNLNTTILTKNPTSTSTNPIEANKERSDLHRVLYSIYQRYGIRNGKNDMRNDSTISSYFEKDLMLSDPTLFSVWNIDFKNTSSQKSIYITLGALCSIINKNCLLYNNSGVPLISIYVDTAYTRAFYHKDQISIDPAVCLVPSAENGIFSLNYKNITNALKWNIIGEDGLSMILFRIPININIVCEILNEISDSSKTGEVSIQKLLQQLLDKVSKSLGNVNDFNVSYDSEFNKIVIYDMTRIPGYKLLAFEIPTYGLDSVVLDYKIYSEIFPEMSTMISIAAQNGGSALSIDGSSLSLFNERLNDRIMDNSRNVLKTTTPFYGTRGLNNVEDPQNEQEKVRKRNKELFLDRINKIRNYLNTSVDVFNYNSTDAVAMYSILGDHLKYMKSIQKPYRTTALIPIKIDLTLDGISNIKIGETFTIPPNRLPSDYNGRVAFIVVGVSHNVTNKWVTKITGQMMPTGMYDSGVSPMDAEMLITAKAEIGKQVAKIENTQNAPGNIQFNR